MLPNRSRICLEYLAAGAYDSSSQSYVNSRPLNGRAKLQRIELRAVAADRAPHLLRVGPDADAGAEGPFRPTRHGSPPRRRPWHRPDRRRAGAPQPPAGQSRHGRGGRAISCALGCSSGAPCQPRSPLVAVIRWVATPSAAQRASTRLGRATRRPGGPVHRVVGVACLAPVALGGRQGSSSGRDWWLLRRSSVSTPRRRQARRRPWACCQRTGREPCRLALRLCPPGARGSARRRDRLSPPRSRSFALHAHLPASPFLGSTTTHCRRPAIPRPSGECSGERAANERRLGCPQAPA